MELFVVNHKTFNIIEIVCYNSKVHKESPRIYVNTAIMFTKFKEDEIAEAIRSKKEVFIRQRKPVDVKKITNEVMNKFAVQFILSRLVVSEAGENFRVDLRPLVSDSTKQVDIKKISEDGIETTEQANVLDIIEPIPNGLKCLNITFYKITTQDFQNSLAKLRRETNNLVVETSYADMAINSIEGIKNAMSEKLKLELELKRSYSIPRLRWVHAINRVLIQNYVKRATIRIAEVEEIQRKRKEAEDSKLTIVASPTNKSKKRNTIDNSKLPLFQEGSAPRGANQHKNDADEEHLPPINEKPNSFRTRRRQRQQMVANREFRRSFEPQIYKEPLTIEEIVSQSYSKAPTLRNSYSDKAMQKIEESRCASIRLESIAQLHLGRSNAV